MPYFFLPKIFFATAHAMAATINQEMMAPIPKAVRPMVSPFADNFT
jgi:hypothetical protein